MVAFPLGLDAFSNPASTDTLDAPSFLHDVLHAHENDAAWELMSKVGIDSSADINSLDYAMETHTHVPALRDDGGLINHADLTGGTHPPDFHGAQATASGGAYNDAVISWSVAEGWDTDSFHETATNPSRFVVPAGKSGFYLVVTEAIFTAGGADTDRGLRLLKNSVSFGEDNRPNLTGNGISASGIVEAVEGDILETMALKGAGNMAANAPTFMTVTFLGHRVSQVLSLSRSRGRSNTVATLV